MQRMGELVVKGGEQMLHSSRVPDFVTFAKTAPVF